MIVGLLTSTLKNIATSKKEGKKGALVKADGKKDKESTSAKVAKPSSIVVRPKTSVVPKPKASFYKSLAVRPSMGTGGGQESYGSLTKRLDSVIQNMNTLNLIQKDELNSEKKKDKDTRVESQREQQKAAEEKSEIRSQKKAERQLFKMAGPGSTMFDGAINFLKGFVFSTAMMQLLNWFSDPKSTEKIFKFLKENFVGIMLGVMGVLAITAGQALLGLGGILAIAVPILLKSVGLLVSILLSPPGLVALGALGLIAATASAAGAGSQVTGPNAVWANPKLTKPQRKAILESTFGHLPPDKWDPIALALYKKTLKEMKVDYDAAIKALEPKRAAHLKAVQQYQRTMGQQSYVPTPGQGIYRGMDPRKFSSFFLSKESFRSKPHEGIDDPQNVGTPISYKIGGKIIDAYRTSSRDRDAGGGYGQYIKVLLDDGKVLLMAHLSEISSWVRSGVRFQANEILGKTGGAEGAPGSGRSGGPHLHFEQHSTPGLGLQETTSGKVDPIKGGGTNVIQYGGIDRSAQAAAVSRQASYDMPVASASFVPVSVGGGQQQISSATGTKFVSIPESGMLNRYYDDNIQSSLYLT